MIEARRSSAWKGSYGFTVDGRPVASWHPSTWATGGVLDLGGRRLEVRANLWGTAFTMLAPSGQVIASAAHVGRKNWVVEADGVAHTFRRASLWRSEEELLAQGQVVGSVRRTSAWRADAAADLPGLPPEVALFALAVVLACWDAQAASG